MGTSARTVMPVTLGELESRNPQDPEAHEAAWKKSLELMSKDVQAVQDSHVWVDRTGETLLLYASSHVDPASGMRKQDGIPVRT